MRFFFADYEMKQFHALTEVEFGTLSDDVILEYIKTGEPL